MSKRLVIAYIYGPRNAGDMALNYGALDLLKLVGDFDVTGVSRFSQDHESFAQSKSTLESVYPSFRLLPFPIHYDRRRDSFARQALSHVRGMGMYLASGVGLFSRAAASLDRHIGDCDHFLFNGGNVLFCRGLRDWLRLTGIAYPLQRAIALRKPIAFLPQSIPAASGLGGRQIRRYLESASFVSFRESASLKQIGLRRQDALCTLDLAFFMEAMDRNAADQIISRHRLDPFRFVPIVPRATTLGDQAYLDTPEYGRTVECVVHLCERVVQMGCSPLLIVQVETDLRVARDCQAALSDQGYTVGIEEQYNPLILRALYASARAIVTMRLHAAIFALSVGTVAYGVSRPIWGKKMPGIFSDLGIESLHSSFEAIQNAEWNGLVALSQDDLLNQYKQSFLERIQSQKQDFTTRLRRRLS